MPRLLRRTPLQPPTTETGHDAVRGFHQPGILAQSAGAIEKLRAAGQSSGFGSRFQDGLNDTAGPCQSGVAERRDLHPAQDDSDVVGFQWWMPKIVHTISDNMLTIDEPDHTRLRAIVDEAFLPGRA